VELTPAGKRMLAKATTVFEEELRSRLGRVLTDRSLHQFAATLGRLRGAGHTADLATKTA
jgi:hypothetical protein